MLRIENVGFRYGERRILDDVSLEVRGGELVGIVGPNGAGKTTLLRLVSGVLRPHTGRILAYGVDMSTLKPNQRARLVSVVPQNPVLPSGSTLMDLVLMGRNPHLGLLQWEGPRDIEIAQRAMKMTGTLHLRDRNVETLSGGERQRGLVALALAQDAPLMLLDEPTSSLDLAHQIAVMDLVADVQRSQGGAVIVAMHDLTLAAQYCGRIVIMAEGRRYRDGSPGSVLTPEEISRVYGTPVAVLPHPDGGSPVVLPLSGRRRSDGGGEPPSPPAC